MSNENGHRVGCVCEACRAIEKKGGLLGAGSIDTENRNELPPGCKSPRRAEVRHSGDSTHSWIIWHSEFTGRGETKSDARADAWVKWEHLLKRFTGMSRAEFEQSKQDHKVMEILRWRAGITCGQ